MPLDDVALRRKREVECYVQCVTLKELEAEEAAGRVSPFLRELLDCPDCGDPYHLCQCDEEDSLFDADELGIDPEY